MTNRTVINILLAGAFLLLSATTGLIRAQPVPGEDENIPFLVTFGKDGETSWGDDDFVNIFFFTIPLDFNDPIYIRVFDPDTGGDNDEINGYWNTRMRYSVYGGAGAHSIEAGRGTIPDADFRTGTLLSTRVFGNEPEWDNEWYTFGPFNPADGEYDADFQSHIFKIICEGISGNDGNLYRYYLSSEPDRNVPIEGANAFTYKYTFRLWNDTTSISHIYPFVDSATIYVRVSNFDWDYDGEILVVSEVRQGSLLTVSGDDNWEEDRLQIQPGELNRSLNIQFHKRKDQMVRNNNVVIMVENQYGELLKFFSAPIVGVPVYRGNVGVRHIR